MYSHRIPNFWRFLRRATSFSSACQLQRLQRQTTIERQMPERRSSKTHMSHLHADEHLYQYSCKTCCLLLQTSTNNLKPGTPSPHQDVGYHCNSGETNKALHVVLVELLGFIVRQPGYRGPIRHTSTPSLNGLAANDAHNPRNLGIRSAMPRHSENHAVTPMPNSRPAL